MLPMVSAQNADFGRLASLPLDGDALPKGAVMLVVMAKVGPRPAPLLHRNMARDVAYTPAPNERTTRAHAEPLPSHASEARGAIFDCELLGRINVLAGKADRKSVVAECRIHNNLIAFAPADAAFAGLGFRCFAKLISTCAGRALCVPE